MNHLNRLCAALRGANLARAGAMLALALGAAQVGAVTYTVPLQFNITLVAPVCSLVVGGATVDATTSGGVHATGHTVNLTDGLTISAVSSPDNIARAIAGSDITANAAGIYFPSHTVNRRVSSPPASVTCTAGTPVILKVTKDSTAVAASPSNAYMAGAPTTQVSNLRLPVGMLMGIAGLAPTATGVSGIGGVTLNSTVPTLSTTADGSTQTLTLTTAIYTANPASLATGYEGQWTYKFNVSLEF